MSRNKLNDLNDHLFAQLERLGDEDMSPDQIEQEVKRADAIVKVSGQITGIAAQRLSAARLFAEHGSAILPMLPQVGESPNTSSPKQIDEDEG